MPNRILELFGYAPDDQSDVARGVRSERRCPFIRGECRKTFNDGTKSGACSLDTSSDGPVIICPQRFYYEEKELLRQLAAETLGDHPFLPGTPENIQRVQSPAILAFGQGSGREIRLPSRKRKSGSRGSFFVDWILALVSSKGLDEFSAVEIQAIDTTGSYRAEQQAYMSGQPFGGRSTVGLNWENVNKRILIQLIYKGHILRREPLCAKGMHFVCPEPVYDRIVERLGGNLSEIHPQPGALSFHWYNLDSDPGSGYMRGMIKKGSFTTTVDQVANAFVAPYDLPPAGSYEEAIRDILGGG